ncbi:GNAT family N-acetyltransferase [Chryseolinea sp. T2]|uniref:GNAT family N-acetyltransferase n=1 Tax=Chryseolinea sp. T2 TaxID=3129255 RepID=UPI003077B9C6
MLLQTQRLNLRHFLLTDSAFVLRLLNEPSFLKFIGDRKVRTNDDARVYIANRFIASYEKNGYGLYMVEDKQGTPIGMCGLVKRDPVEDPDVGFAFVPEAWLKGLGYEAANAVMDYARHTLKLKRVLGITVPDNVASIKTLEKLGLKYLRADVTKDTNEAIRIYEIIM